MKKVVLAGNAVTAEILNSYLCSDNRYEVAGLTVDDEHIDKGGIEGITTVGLSRLQATFPADEFSVVMAVGYNDLNRVRESIFKRLKDMGYTIEAYVHPDARVYTDHPPGEGCVILPSAVVEPHARVGANTMIWCNVTIAHHSHVDENCWVAAGTVLSGQARVLRNSFVGVNATVVNEITVSEYNIIGAGALITRDTRPNSVHLARSAEPFRYSSEDYVKHFGI